MLFEKFKMIMPKNKAQFITPKQAYCSRNNDGIVLKVDRSCCIILKSDGTYEFTESKKLKLHHEN